MHKPLISYLIILFFTGCSVSGKLGNNKVGEGDKIELGILKSKNLANNSFFIQRADIELVTNEDRKSFLASVKFNIPDTFLISIRSKSGIEAARIFMTADTLLINDRINKMMYFGSGDALKKRYGYSGELIYLLFGGFLEDFSVKGKVIDCNQGEAKEIFQLEDYRLIYFIDCKAGEVKRIQINSEKGGKNIIIKFFGQENKADVKYYKRIEINTINDYELVKIVINKIEIPYKGRIEFIPGRNFEQVEIK
ncbi:MAG TPA: DUF4292 domain-containing protein [Bacteroidales bacterium]|nr:DUF4292 domain-containing protein [Bacteroidales bacterium]